MNEQFQTGDQVMLMSGGPYMTVDKVTKDQVICVWFHEQELKLASFGAALLRSRADVEAEQREKSQKASAARQERIARMNRSSRLY